MSEPAEKIEPKRLEPVADEPKTVASGDEKPRPPTIAEIRRRRARRLTLRVLLGVGLPTLAAVVYYGFVATPQYESVAAFTVQSADTQAAGGIEMILASVPSSATRDALLVQQHIQSRDMLRLLEERHGFSAHYSADGIDYFSQLDPNAPFEDVYEYYSDKVEAEYDTQSGTVHVSVRAFSADKASELTHAIVDASESMVNRMMDQARQDRIALAQNEVDRAETRLGEARNELLKLQSERSELNPAASAEAVLTVRGSLETELAAARAELNAMRASLQPTAPQLVSQQQRVSALARQVREQTRRLAEQSGSDGLSADIAAFEPAVAEKEFAQRAYESALVSLEAARLEASRQHRYLAIIAEPSAPDEPTHPRVFIAVLTVFMLSFLLLGIGSLLVASMREHANL